jgi:hypothetical protein
MKITKTFIQMYVAQDCEGRQYAWKDVNRTYDEAVNRINPYAIAVREVVKEFDPETFTITETETRRTEG